MNTACLRDLDGTADRVSDNPSVDSDGAGVNIPKDGGVRTDNQSVPTLDGSMELAVDVQRPVEQDTPYESDIAVQKTGVVPGILGTRRLRRHSGSRCVHSGKV